MTPNRECFEFQEDVQARLNTRPYLMSPYSQRTEFPAYFQWCAGWLYEDSTLRRGEPPPSLQDLTEAAIDRKIDELKHGI